MNLRLVLDELRRLGDVGDQMTVVGGGSRSELWRQILADAWEIEIVKTNVGQEAGSLGAAAVAAVGCGLWDDFGRVDEAHTVQSVTSPIPTMLRSIGSYCRSSATRVSINRALAMRSEH